MRKVLFVATVVKTHIMEFHIPYLKMLKDMGWETAVAARNDYSNPDECNIPYCDQYYDLPFERNPLNTNNIRAYIILKHIIDENEFDIIHCHTPMGACIARLAADKARRKGCKVIYTAHGFHFYNGAPLVNWLVYYPVERWLAHKTDVVITINREDYERAKKFKAGKVVYVPGVGVDIKKFSHNVNLRDKKRSELGFDSEEFLLLSVGELIPRKNHIVMLQALAKIKADGHISNFHFLICGSGILESDLKKRVEEFGLSDHVHFLGYRNDVCEIYNASDLFLFMSLQEGLPVALMESMACGLPVVCSDIRGNKDLIENKINGEIIESNPDLLAKTILWLKENESVRKKYSIAAKKTIEQYDIHSVSSKVLKIYENEWGG